MHPYKRKPHCFCTYRQPHLPEFILKQGHTRFQSWFILIYAGSTLWLFSAKFADQTSVDLVGREDGGRVRKPPQDRGSGHHRPTEALRRVL
jgi:hypothetical protein